MKHKQKWVRNSNIHTLRDADFDTEYQKFCGDLVAIALAVSQVIYQTRERVFHVMFYK